VTRPEANPAVSDLAPSRPLPPPPDGPRVVAFGGGHGLSASLTALRQVTPHLTAVVTVADDGGSSGRIRAELDALPPGDLRMALAALADGGPDGQLWAELLQHRFGGHGALAGHPVGNLLLTGLVDLLGDPVAALRTAGQLVGAVGIVLPMSVDPLEIGAEVVGLDRHDPTRIRRIRGQVAVATTPGRIVSVHLVPATPRACPQALDALREADWVVLGPGSWFSSVLPHLLVPELVDALGATSARKLLALNLAPQAGETDGFSPEAHLEVLAAHAPDVSFDVVLADEQAVVDDRGLMAAARSLGAALVLGPVAAGDGTPRHDPHRLAVAYAGVFGRAVGDARDEGTRTPWR